MPNGKVKTHRRIVSSRKGIWWRRVREERSRRLANVSYRKTKNKILHTTLKAMHMSITSSNFRHTIFFLTGYDHPKMI